MYEDCDVKCLTNINLTDLKWIGMYNVIEQQLLFLIQMLLLKHPELLQFIFFQEVFLIIRISKFYVCTVLVNIRNIYVKYSHCRPIQFN